jgi:pimeloyl-ACP methyl ester carboxylesterase
LAAAQSGRIGFLVLIASTGVTPAEQMRYLTQQDLRRAGYGEDVVKRAVDLRLRYEAWVHGERGDEPSLLADLAAAAREPWFELTYIRDSLPDAEGVRSWIEEMDFDPRPIFASVNVPTLLFYGRDDDVSPVEPSIDAWRASDAPTDIVVIPDAAHDLRLPDGRLAPEYEPALIAWLERTAA